MDDDLITPDAELIDHWPEVPVAEALDPGHDEAAGPMITAWLPGAEVRHHNGDPLPSGLVLFAPPPAEIGRVRTAHSTLQAGKRPWTTLSRLLFGAGLGSTVAVVLGFFDVVGPVQLLVGLAVLVGTWLLTRFRYRVSYVGAEGLARLTCAGRPDRIVKVEQFRFADAEDLRSSQTRHYHNGIYTNTRYHFAWTDAAGQRVFKLAGSYRGEKVPPKPKDSFHFAESAEVAWTAHRWERFRAERPPDGIIRFRLTGPDWLGLQPGALHFGRKAGVQTWTAAEFGGLEVVDGVLKIKRVDAQEGWFSAKGVEKVPIASLANTQVFLLLAGRWLKSPATGR